MTKYRLTVTIEVDTDSVPDVLNYVNNAVGAWSGQLHPENPFFDLEVVRVECRDTYLDLSQDEVL